METSRSRSKSKTKLAPCNSGKKEPAPGDVDNMNNNVYLGRGGLGNKLRKNSLYRELIVKYHSEYCKLNPKAKREFAREKIVREIQNKGGRFVKEHDLKKGTWVAIENESAILDKVMQAFRDERNRPQRDKRPYDEVMQDVINGGGNDTPTSVTTSRSIATSETSTSETAFSLTPKTPSAKKTKTVKINSRSVKREPNHVGHGEKEQESIVVKHEPDGQLDDDHSDEFLRRREHEGATILSSFKRSMWLPCFDGLTTSAWGNATKGA